MPPRRLSVCLPLCIASVAVAACATSDRRDLVRDTHCADFSVQLYFPEESAEVTRAAERVLSDAAEQVRGCPAPRITVVGLADYRGPPNVNLALSRRRAEAVAVLLQKNGFAAPSFRMTAAGETGAVTPSGQIEPLRRRADVFFDIP
jgi:peptidoglycan-associated lipoprotein